MTILLTDILHCLKKKSGIYHHTRRTLNEQESKGRLIGRRCAPPHLFVLIWGGVALFKILRINRDFIDDF